MSCFVCHEPRRTVGDGSPMSQHRYFGEPSDPKDYNPNLFRSSGASHREPSAALLLSHYGFTIYGSARTEIIGINTEYYTPWFVTHEPTNFIN